MVRIFHTAPLHYMENKAHFAPLIHTCKVQYKPLICFDSHLKMEHFGFKNGCGMSEHTCIEKSWLAWDTDKQLWTVSNLKQFYH